MTAALKESDRELLENVYRLFNRRDIDGVFQWMDPQVDWPNGMEGGRVHGLEAVRAYWTRQWRVVDPHVAPVAFAVDDDGRIVVDVRQVVRDMTGHELVNQYIDHIYTIENGLIRRMEIGAVRPVQPEPHAPQ